MFAPPVLISLLLLAGQATQAPAAAPSTAQPAAVEAATPPQPSTAPSPAPPAPTTNTAATTIESTQDKDDRVVCRREQRTGSLMVQRNCRSVGERRRERDQARDQLHSTPTVSPSSGAR